MRSQSTIDELSKESEKFHHPRKGSARLAASRISKQMSLRFIVTREIASPDSEVSSPALPVVAIGPRDTEFSRRDRSRHRLLWPGTPGFEVGLGYAAFESIHDALASDFAKAWCSAVRWVHTLFGALDHNAM